MAINSKEALLASIRDFLHDPEGHRYKDETLYDMMQEALDEIATETTFFRQEISYYTALTKDGKYPLPDDLISLQEVFYNYCEVPVMNEPCPCRICPTDINPRKVFMDTNNRDSFTFYPIPIPEIIDNAVDEVIDPPYPPPPDIGDV